MTLVCVVCGSVRKRGSILRCRNHAPHHSRFADIDETLIPAIVTLNQKGYTTRFCCAGHFWSPLPNCYIAFDKEIILPFLPDGYEVDIDYDTEESDIIVIRHEFTEKSVADTAFAINDNARLLLQWAEALPERKEKNGHDIL